MKLYDQSKFVLLTMLLFAMTFMVNAQNLTQPRASQFASITQRVGISDVTINYHSPGVKEREVWGKLVPYGQIWRAGANENTTITFTHDAKIEGQKVPAGTYGLFMMPKDKDNVSVLLSKYSKSWGTVSPKEDELVAKVDVKTKSIDAQEWLSFDFVDRSGSDVTAVLRWDTMEIPFNISFDVHDIVLDNMRAELKGLAGFNWRSYAQAAAYCLRNEVNLEEAMTWVDRSIQMNKSFTNLKVKADLLAKHGEMENSKKLIEEALPIANGNELNRYGYQMLGKGDTKKAIEIFDMNIKKNPDHAFIWGFTDSLGEAYLKDGNKKMALKYYKEARKLAPENQYGYLDNVIAGIESSM